MSRIRPIHFETFGSVARVLREADKNVPKLFPANAEELLKSIHKIVKNYASQNKWDVVALNVSKGITRYVLNDLIQHDFPHHGGIVIDNGIPTTDHSVFESRNTISDHRDRLTVFSEAAGQVLIVVYGLDSVTRSSDIPLLLRHLRRAGMMLDMIMDEEELTIQEREHHELLDQRMRRLKQARELLLLLTNKFKAEDYTLQNDPDVISGNMYLFMLYSTIYSLKMSPGNSTMQHLLDQLLYQIHMIPDRFHNLGFDLSPYINSARELKKGAIAPKPMIVENNATPEQDPGRVPQIVPTLQPE